MRTSNPYHSTTEVTRVPARRSIFILHPTFAISWIAGWCALTTSLIYMIDLAWPIPLLDREFYFGLYASIGATAGLLSWFTARLIALSRLQFGTLVVLMLPLAFVFLLAATLNPLVGGLTGIIAGTTFALAWVARRGASVYIRPIHGIDEPDDARESPSRV